MPKDTPNPKASQAVTALDSRCDSDDSRSNCSAPTGSLHRETRCLTCCTLIEPGATKCIHCNSYQNYKRYFSIGLPFLSLLVALASVFTVMISEVSKLPRSEVQIRVVKVEVRDFPENSRSTYVRLWMQNRGNRPATVRSIHVAWKSAEQKNNTLRNPDYFNVETATHPYPDGGRAIPIVLLSGVTGVFEVVWESHEEIIETTPCRVRLQVLNWRGQAEKMELDCWSWGHDVDSDVWSS